MTLLKMPILQRRLRQAAKSRQILESQGVVHQPRGQPVEVDPGLDLDPEAAPQVEAVVGRRLQPGERRPHRGRRPSQRLVLVLGLVPPRTCRCDGHLVLVVDLLAEVVQLVQEV